MGLSLNYLYHKTDLHKANAILNENTFRLSTSLGTLSDKTKKLWFLSTSTEPGAYRRGSSGVILVLDRDLLETKYELTTFEYWPEEWRKNPSFDEKEVRVLSDEPKLTPARKYIREIHADWRVREKEDYYSSYDYMRIRKLMLLAKKTRIPVYWYENTEDLNTTDKSKAKPSSFFEKRAIRNEEQMNARRSGLNSYEYKKWKTLLSIFPAKSYVDIPPDYYKYLSSYSDGHLSFTADIHNATKSGESPLLPYIYKLHRQMQLAGISDFQKFYQLMLEKVQSLRSQATASYLDRLKILAEIKAFKK